MKPAPGWKFLPAALQYSRRLCGGKLCEYQCAGGGRSIYADRKYAGRFLYGSGSPIAGGGDIPVFWRRPDGADAPGHPQFPGSYGNPERFVYSTEPSLQSLCSTPSAYQSVMPNSALYLSIYFWGMTFSLFYNMGSGILRAIGDSKNPLFYLIAASLVNIVLDFFICLRVWNGSRGSGDCHHYCAGGQRGAGDESFL